ncbi:MULTISPECIES: hypothetical protein [Caproicibacterium]|uniref:Uncharacterized protein n=1 Tax=Caproicibacterium argilliputei TaxID=3030016 RepID=A0AA97H1E1_9FIRM|nr:hypothetical protein [Caproicibacterium argilliputei]WOC31575.1 hypothetical protein PXC00_10175 [Caproicibacterium argilliputei]
MALQKQVPCPCRFTRCRRHGDCAACRVYHQEKGSPTACERLKRKKAEQPQAPKTHHSDLEGTNP